MRYLRYLVKLCFAGAVLMGPVAVGAIPTTKRAAATLLIAMLFAAYAFLPQSKAAARNLVTVVLSACIGVTLIDVVSRPFVLKALLVRPAVMFRGAWPRLPLVNRYFPNVHYVGTVTGDLGGVLGVRSLLVKREERFVTDQFGFRNELPASWQSHPLDAIVLGDSMADGSNTTQEDTLSSILASKYGLHIYNLSISAGAPWTEYVTLTSEIDRLPVKPAGTVVLWMLTTATDLAEGSCYFPFQEGKLPYQGTLGSLRVQYDTFRERSTFRLLQGLTWRRVQIARLQMPQRNIVRRQFLDGKDLLFYLRYARRARLSAENVQRDSRLPCLEATFAAMKELADRKHLQIAVVVVPCKEEVYSWVLDGGPPWSSSVEPSGFSTVFQDISKRTGFQVLDLKPFLIEASRRRWEEGRELLWWHDDLHWNPAGHSEAASVLQRELLRTQRD
jgi:hypothetical protein